MMDLMLPGREPEPTDYEARCALQTLLEAEKLKGSDADLLDRICEQIEYNRSMLDRVYAIVEDLKSGDKDVTSKLKKFLKEEY